jgi:hypothetical protein
MEVRSLQISNTAQQIQSAQRTQNQSAKIEGSKSEEANESSSEKATEALKNAVAKTTGVGINFDKSA